jgi:hypothetical protein
MKHNIFILGIFFQLFVLRIYGQIEVNVDERLEQKVSARLGRELYGFRIQLAFDSDKQQVDIVRMNFLNKFPELETYITFEAPNFNLKAGNFRTQIEAELIKEKMVLQFPLNNIIKEKINLPSIN